MLRVKQTDTKTNKGWNVNKNEYVRIFFFSSSCSKYWRSEVESAFWGNTKSWQ